MLTAAQHSAVTATQSATSSKTKTSKPCSGTGGRSETVCSVPSNPIFPKLQQMTHSHLAFQTAVALAVNDSKDSSPLGSKDSSHAIPEIKEKHLEQVVKLSTAFKKYMKATRHNKDESENAYYYGNRDDEANTRRRERREPAL